MPIKKIYFFLTMIIFAFLVYDCGGNKSNEPAQGQNSNGKTEVTLPAGNPARGYTYFMQVCSACHGKDGKGLPKLGKDLTTSKFVTDKSDAELFKFIEVGRLATDPLNTTGVAMPPKGGNPAFTDQQIMDVISYVRQIHE